MSQNTEKTETKTPAEPLNLLGNQGEGCCGGSCHTS